MRVDMPTGKSGVYKIKCIKNNRLYIGSSEDFALRFAQHYGALKKGKHPNTELQRDWNKHGMDAFVFETIEITSVKACRHREQHHLGVVWANEPKRLYNRWQEIQYRERSAKSLNREGGTHPASADIGPKGDNKSPALWRRDGRFDVADFKRWAQAMAVDGVIGMTLEATAKRFNADPKVVARVARGEGFTFSS